MKQNIPERYFSQKSFSIMEIILILLATISAIIATFVNGGGPVGFPILFLCIFGIVILRSTKIKDDDIDKILQQIISNNEITISDTTIICYDLHNIAVKKRKDGKLCSRRCFITNISTHLKTEITFDIYIVDLISNTVEFFSHTVNNDNDVKVELIEETIKSNVGWHKISYLRIDNFDHCIPVTLSDYKTYNIIEKICKTK